MKRIAVKGKRSDGGGNYFAEPKALNFVSTGCKVLDLALGGGWAESRIANIVGDKSTGKTLLCIETIANFFLRYPKGSCWYREAESAFDKPYAAALGMPVNRVDFGIEPIETVEQMFNDMVVCIEEATKSKQPGLYILDSLDALTDSGELDRKFGEGSYGTGKAKDLSKMFRMLVRKLAAARVTLLIVSQVRDKIGLSFGRATTRSGGRALDFYASQVLYLAHIGRLVKTVRGVKRPYGVRVKAQVDKNKIALPFREAEFEIHFGYGIDDAAACVEWLKDVKRLKDIKLVETKVKDYLDELCEMNASDYAREIEDLHKACTTAWYEIESQFLPRRVKYGQAREA